VEAGGEEEEVGWSGVVVEVGGVVSLSAAAPLGWRVEGGGPVEALGAEEREGNDSSSLIEGGLDLPPVAVTICC
jgi:hypothetical protein